MNRAPLLRREGEIPLANGNERKKTSIGGSAVIEGVLAKWSSECALSQNLCTLKGFDDEQAPLSFTYGEARCTSQCDKESQRSQNVFLQPPTPCHVNVQSFDSRITFRQSNQSRDFITGDDEQGQTSYIQLGSVLHNIFSTIHTTADIDGALRQLQLDGVLYNEDVTMERITTMLRRRLEHPKVADWFSGRWQLFNECTILGIVDGEVVERRPDRVMTDGQQWIVVDFKFGVEHEGYHDQVREYMTLLRQMGHSHVSGYLWFVYSNRIVEVSQ